MITHELTEHGECWSDMTEPDVSTGTVSAVVQDLLDVQVASSQCFLVILTPGYFKSPSLRALQCALNHNVTVVSCYPSRYNIGSILNEAPDTVAEIRSILSRKIDIRCAPPAPRPLAQHARPCTRRERSPRLTPSHAYLLCSDPELFAVGMRQITRGALDDASSAAGSRGQARRGPQNFSVSVVSDSGSAFNLTLRIETGVAMVGKQNPDGSVTRFRGPAPDKEGLMRLEGIDARNAGAYLSGVIPAYAKGSQFTLEVRRCAPPATARAPNCASLRAHADRRACAVLAGESLRKRRPQLDRDVRVSRRATDTQ